MTHKWSLLALEAFSLPQFPVLGDFFEPDLFTNSFTLLLSVVCCLPSTLSESIHSRLSVFRDLLRGCASRLAPRNFDILG